MSNKSISKRFPLGTRVEILEGQMKRLVSFIDEELKKIQDNMEQVVLRQELSAHNGIELHKMIGNSQVEIDALYYMLSRFRKRRFSIQNLESMVREVIHADAVGGGIGGFLRVYATDKPQKPVEAKEEDAEPEPEEALPATGT